MDEIVFKEIFGLDLESQVVEYGHKKCSSDHAWPEEHTQTKQIKAVTIRIGTPPTPGIITGIYKY